VREPHGGKVGLLLGLRCEAASALRYQPHSYLLRAHPSANVADISLSEELINEAALWGRQWQGGSLGRPGLPKRASEGGLGRGRYPFGHRAIRAAPWREATHRERSLFRASRGSLGWARRWRPRSGRAGHQDLKAKISAPTPTPFWSTGCWGALKVTSRSYGHDPDNRHLEPETTVKLL
jgi:hypothetical protein